jgi:pilus assembly protein TadC
MGNKTLIVLTGVGAVMLCAACALGPVFLVAITGWISSLFWGLSSIEALGVVVFGSLGVYALLRALSSMHSARRAHHRALDDV